MKHTLTLAAALTVLSASAQPYLQYSNWPTTSLTFPVHTMTDPGSVTEPTDGANQTWDFSSAQFALFANAELRPAAGTPYAASYPSTNWAFIATPTGMAGDYRYMEVSATGVQNAVSHAPSAPNVYSDPEQVLAFPLSLGGSWSDTYASPDNSGSETWTYSGHGTLITALGTFTDQLKLESSSGDIVIWNAAPLYPRLISNSSGVNLFGPATVGIGDVVTPTALFVAPNPAMDVLNVTGAVGLTQWSITDTQGRVLINGNDNSLQRIDVSSLASGNYVVVVRDGASRRTEHFHKL